MGGKNEKYINSIEDYLEKPIKKGKNFNEVCISTSLKDINEISEIIIQPNKWNIFHLTCWYNNSDLLKEILNISSLNKDYINKPDINGEPPIAICCYVDSVDCLILLSEKGALKQFSKNNNEGYREGLNLNKLCVYHDAFKCFQYLNPDLTIESEELDDLYDLAKKNGSDNISALFEDIKIYEGLESIISIKEEDKMEEISF